MHLHCRKKVNPRRSVNERLRDQAFDDLIRDTAAVCLGRNNVRATVADQLTAIPQKLSELRAQLDGLPKRNMWTGTVLALRRQMSAGEHHFNNPSLTQGLNHPGAARRAGAGGRGNSSDSSDTKEPVKIEPRPPAKPAGSTPANGAAPVAAKEVAAPRKALWQGQREAQAAKLARQAAARRESGVSGRRIAALALAEQQRAARTAPPPSTPAARTAPSPSTPAAQTSSPPSTPANGTAAAPRQGLREAQAAKLARQAAARRESGVSGRHLAAKALAKQRRAAQTAPPPSTPANGAAAAPQQGLREAQAAKLARQAAARRESGVSGRHLAAKALIEQQRAARQAVIVRQGQTEQAVDEGARRTGAAVDQAAGVAKGMINTASNTAEQAADSECLLHCVWQQPSSRLPQAWQGRLLTVRASAYGAVPTSRRGVQLACICRCLRGLA